jgi:hypothetical protein
MRLLKMKKSHLFILCLVLVAQPAIWATEETEAYTPEYYTPEYYTPEYYTPEYYTPEYYTLDDQETYDDADSNPSTKPPKELSKQEKRTKKVHETMDKLNDTKEKIWNSQALLVPKNYIEGMSQAGQDWANLITDPEIIKTRSAELKKKFGKSFKRIANLTKKGWKGAGNALKNLKNNPIEALKEGTEKMSNAVDRVINSVASGTKTAAGYVKDTSATAVKAITKDPSAKTILKVAKGINSVGGAIATMAAEGMYSPKSIYSQVEFIADYPVFGTLLTVVPDLPEVIVAVRAAATALKAAGVAIGVLKATKKLALGGKSIKIALKTANELDKFVPGFLTSVEKTNPRLQEKAKKLLAQYDGFLSAKDDMTKAKKLGLLGDKTIDKTIANLDPASEKIAEDIKKLNDRIKDTNKLKDDINPDTFLLTTRNSTVNKPTEPLLPFMKEKPQIAESRSTFVSNSTASTRDTMPLTDKKIREIANQEPTFSHLPTRKPK